MSINAMVVAVSIAAGPSLAGAILSVASWNWLFAINVPLGICAIITGYFLLPQNPCKDGPKRKFDKIGGISNALTFGLLIYSLEGDVPNSRDKVGSATLTIVPSNTDMVNANATAITAQ